MNLPCPACGFLTIDEGFYGTYSICPVCGWEDDGVQLANPACGGGANGESLIEAQEQGLVEHPIAERTFRGLDRGPNWRPLNDAEIKIALQEREAHYWKNKAVFYPNEAYWNRNA